MVGTNYIKICGVLARIHSQNPSIRPELEYVGVQSKDCV